MLFLVILLLLAFLLIAMIADNRGRTHRMRILAQNGQLTQERFDALMGKEQRRALAITLAVALALLAALIAYALIRSHL